MTVTAKRSHALPDEPEIYCEDLVRIYHTQGVEVQALQGLDLTVDAGDLVALVGASGSGKSTLLAILSGHDRPTGGKARVAGTDLLTMNAAQRVEFQRNKVGFVWQQTSRNLFGFLTAKENVALPMTIAGTKDPERADWLLELLGVTDCANRLPSAMSGGQQQRVAIATALANSPRVLLADEPTGELDEENSDMVLSQMAQAATTLGTTVLVVTHDPRVSEHVRRTVQIRDGRTSTEVLRRSERGDDGEHRLVAEEYTVIDKAGRIQLPPAHVEALGLRHRVRLQREPDHVEVYAAHDEARARRGMTDERASSGEESGPGEEQA